MGKERNVYRTEDGSLYEASLNRILTHTHRGFVIISASQGRDEETEENAFENLKRQVRDIGASFIELDGIWTDEKTGEVFREKSLFVPYPGEEWGTLEHFIDKFLELARANNQQAIITGDEKKIELVYSDKEVINFGEFHPDKLSVAYSKIAEGRHTGRTFVFKGVRVPRGAFDAFVMKHMGYLIGGDFFFRIK